MFEALKKLFGGGTSSEAGKPSCGCCSGEHKSSSSEKIVTLGDLEGFVDYVVRKLVDYPDEVKVSVEDGENGKIIRIVCRKEDTGKIIGKKGKTIIALRSLVGNAAGRLQERVSVEVAD